MSEKDERDIEFDKKVADEKQEIRQKTDNICICALKLRFDNVTALRGGVLGEEEKSALFLLIQRFPLPLFFL